MLVPEKDLFYKFRKKSQSEENFVCNKEQHDSLLPIVSEVPSGFISGYCFYKNWLPEAWRLCLATSGILTKTPLVLGVMGYSFPQKAQTQRQPNCVSIQGSPPYPLHTHRWAQTNLASRDLSRSCSHAAPRQSSFLAYLKRLAAISQNSEITRLCFAFSKGQSTGLCWSRKDLGLEQLLRKSCETSFNEGEEPHLL